MGVFMRARSLPLALPWGRVILRHGAIDIDQSTLRHGNLAMDACKVCLKFMPGTGGA